MALRTNLLDKQAIQLVVEPVWEHLHFLETAGKQLSLRFFSRREHLACSQVAVGRLPLLVGLERFGRCLPDFYGTGGQLTLPIPLAGNDEKYVHNFLDVIFHLHLEKLLIQGFLDRIF